jgi:putative ABC transport system substrate-binding protein
MWSVRFGKESPRQAWLKERAYVLNIFTRTASMSDYQEWRPNSFGRMLRSLPPERLRPALAAKAATATIPIVFVVGFDPVTAGLVESYNRPGGNATGVSLITSPLAKKRVELIFELMPKARNVSMLVNPTFADAPIEVRDAQAAASGRNRQLHTVNAGTAAEIDSAFALIREQGAEALIVSSDPFFTTRREQLAALLARLGIPAIYPFREFTAAGGLMSYGASLAGAYRQAGLYAGRILKGEKPTDLPVVQPTTFELVINLKTAKALGIEVPGSLVARADEVIE